MSKMRPVRAWFQAYAEQRFRDGKCRACANDRAPYSSRCLDCLAKCKAYRDRKKHVAA